VYRTHWFRAPGLELRTDGSATFTGSITVQAVQSALGGTIANASTTGTLGIVNAGRLQNSATAPTAWVDLRPGTFDDIVRFPQFRVTSTGSALFDGTLTVGGTNPINFVSPNVNQVFATMRSSTEFVPGGGTRDAVELAINSSTVWRASQVNFGTNLFAILGNATVAQRLTAQFLQTTSSVEFPSGWTMFVGGTGD